MPKITWLGDEPCLWNEVTFPAGVPVETDDPYMIGKARHNPFFRLEETVLGPMPEMWTNPPLDYTPGDVFGPPIPALQAEHDLTKTGVNALPLKRKRGRPPKVRHNGDQ